MQRTFAYLPSTVDGEILMHATVSVGTGENLRHMGVTCLSTTAIRRFGDDATSIKRFMWRECVKTLRRSVN